MRTAFIPQELCSRTLGSELLTVDLRPDVARSSFPRPKQIGSEFSVGWLRGEVMEWHNSRPIAELNGPDAVEWRRRARTSGARRILGGEFE